RPRLARRSRRRHAPAEAHPPELSRGSGVTSDRPFRPSHLIGAGGTSPGAGEGYARENIRVVAVIQARMGSTRLPGKVLRPIAGQPLLWHIVHRLKACRLLEDIAVATSVNPADEAIVEWGNQYGVIVVRGPEDDVLARNARAAENLDADIILRVSSDAPFIDAGFVDHLIATLIEQDGDYVLMEE